MNRSAPDLDPSRLGIEESRIISGTLVCFRPTIVDGVDKALMG